MLIVSGDSNGTLVVWNYMTSAPIFRSNLHKGQINTMVMFKND